MLQHVSPGASATEQARLTLLVRVSGAVQASKRPSSPAACCPGCVAKVAGCVCGMPWPCRPAYAKVRNTMGAARRAAFFVFALLAGVALAQDAAELVPGLAEAEEAQAEGADSVNPVISNVIDAAGPTILPKWAPLFFRFSRSWTAARPLTRRYPQRRRRRLHHWGLRFGHQVLLQDCEARGGPHRRMPHQPAGPGGERRGHGAQDRAALRRGAPRVQDRPARRPPTRRERSKPRAPACSSAWVRHAGRKTLTRT